MIKLVLTYTFVALLFLTTSAYAETDAGYQRVMKKQSIDCGYAEWPPYLVVDPNTKKVSGMMCDLWELIGKKLDVKINWSTFVAWGEVAEAEKTNKFDVFCVGVWSDAGKLKNMLLSRPVFYNALYLYGRLDDRRFDNNYDAVNKPDVTVVGQEGDVTASSLALKFPNAKSANTAPMAATADTFLHVINKKGDVTIADVPQADDFMQRTPHKLRRVTGKPVVMLSTSISLPVGEHQLKSMIDATLYDLINDGTIAALIKKYDAKETYAPEPDVRLPASH